MYGDKSLPRTIMGGNGRDKTNLEHFITKEEFTEMYHNQKISLKNIVKIIDCSLNDKNFAKLVTSKGWRDLGRLSYEFDASFFKNWNAESAWVYGWLITDGFVSEKARIGIELQKSDVDVLHKIKTLMSFGGNIKETKRNTHTLTISKKELVKDLYNIGFPEENKSFTCSFPTGIPDEFIWHFVRGAFEGDGTVSIESNLLRLSICGISTDLLEGIGNWLSVHGIETSVYQRKDGVLILRTKNMKSALLWAHFMYTESTENMRMDRKYNKYLEFIQNYHKTKRLSAQCNEMVELARQAIAKDVA